VNCSLLVCVEQTTSSLSHTYQRLGSIVWVHVKDTRVKDKEIREVELGWIRSPQLGGFISNVLVDDILEWLLYEVKELGNLFGQIFWGRE
jgi:hypothetical protein